MVILHLRNQSRSVNNHVISTTPGKSVDPSFAPRPELDSRVWVDKQSRSKILKMSSLAVRYY